MYHEFRRIFDFPKVTRLHEIGLRPAVVLFVGLSLLCCRDQRDGLAGRSETPLRFSEHLISDDYVYAWGIGAADLDSDGDMDLTSADFQPHNDLYWYENDGAGNFTRRYIQQDDPRRIERHAIGDIDRDGRPDVAVVKNFYGHLLWFSNSGPPSDGKLWERHVITTKLPGAYDVVLADVDRDGDLDAAGSSWKLGNQFAWFENHGTPDGGEWKKHMIEANIAETRTIRAADLDRDGDVDLLGTASREGQVIWYENSGRPATNGWIKHIIDRKSPRPTHGELADVDRDGDMDAVMALGKKLGGLLDDAVGDARGESAPTDETETNQIVWYENDGRPAAGPWTKHVIMSGFDDAFGAVAADLDQDGDVDVVATSWRTPGRVAWFENHGDPKGLWTMHTLKTDWRSANQVLVADLNGDGRPDIAAAAERGSNEFRWWRNEGRESGEAP